MPLHLLVKWGRWFLQIVDIHVGNLNMKLTGRWFPQIVDRDSGNLFYIQYIYNKNGGVSFWTCLREISGDRVALFYVYCGKLYYRSFMILLKRTFKDKLGYIELLIYRSNYSGPLDFDMYKFYCISIWYIFWTSYAYFMSEVYRLIYHDILGIKIEICLFPDGGGPAVDGGAQHAGREIKGKELIISCINYT